MNYFDKNRNEIKENMKLKCINKDIKSEYGKIEKIVKYDGVLYFDGEKSLFPLSAFTQKDNILIDYEIIWRIGVGIIWKSY